MLQALTYLQNKKLTLGEYFTSNNILLVGRKYKLSALDPVVRRLRRKKFYSEPEYHAYQMDLFNLGKILLQATNLYLPSRNLEMELVEAAKHYSPFWVQFLQDILNPNVPERPTAKIFLR